MENNARALHVGVDLSDIYPVNGQIKPSRCSVKALEMYHNRTLIIIIFFYITTLYTYKETHHFCVYL